MDELWHNPRIANRPAQPYLGEIRLHAGPNIPQGWFRCDGRYLAISYNTDLFEVIGNTYGGDGRTTFALPDLRGRVAVGVGAGPGLSNRKLGEEFGAESVILDVTQLPAHDHTLRATNSSATQTQPAGNVLATASTPQYLNASTSVVMGTDSIGVTGSNAPHANVQPSTTLSYIIAYHSNDARSIVPNASKWPVSPELASPRWPIADIGTGSAVIVDNARDYPWNGRLEIFTSGGVDYTGLEIVEHEDGVGTIWYAIPADQDLAAGPVEPMFVLNPGAGDATPPADGRVTITLEGFGTRLFAISQVMLDFRLGGWGQGVEFNYDLEPRATRLDQHSGLQFTSGGVDYLAIEMLQHEDGIGTIWFAIPKNHDLEAGPVEGYIVLAPDRVNPV
ncbi:tail fiber protein [bacterium]|nr:tail fiber protein [bacterium]